MSMETKKREKKLKEKREKEYGGWNLPEDGNVMKEYDRKWEELYNAVPEWK